MTISISLENFFGNWWFIVWITSNIFRICFANIRIDLELSPNERLKTIWFKGRLQIIKSKNVKCNYKSKRLPCSGFGTKFWFNFFVKLSGSWFENSSLSISSCCLIVWIWTIELEMVAASFSILTRGLTSLSISFSNTSSVSFDIFLFSADALCH